MEANGVCYVCGKSLIWDELHDNCIFEDLSSEESGMGVKEIRCEHCGTLYRYWISTDNDNEAIPCNDQGFGNCLCGGTNIWGGDFMRSDFENNEDGSDLEEDDDAIVRSLTCNTCGAAIEVFETTANEQKSGIYPFWVDKQL